MFGSATAANVKCAKCQAALGPTGTFTVIGSDWYHSWCAPAQPDPRDAEIARLRARVAELEENLHIEFVNRPFT